MPLFSRQRLAIFLMILSLGLLLLFLGLFLRKVYADELGTLKRESSLLFVNSIRGIEGEMFDKIIFRRTANSNFDTTHTVSFRVPPRRIVDSVQIMAYSQDQTAEIRRDTQFRIRVLDGQPITDNPDMSGALSVIVAMGNKGKATDSLSLPGLDSSRIFALLQQNFGQAVKNADLPVTYQVLRIKSDSVEGFMAGSYTDLASGEQYGVALTGYQSHLLRRMLPQALFSGVLFACVALAFLFFYQTMRRQQRLAEQKNDFIRNITHELKTPIATVSVAVEALQHFDALLEPARTREYLDISRLELARLSLLVDKVLRMSLFEKGEQVFNLEPIDIKALMEEIIGAMKLQFEQYGAAVQFQATGTNFSFQGDRLHLTGVVFNLLDNALKYSKSKPDIEVSLEQGNKDFTLRVRDKGIGIPAAYRDKIFEKFFRIPTGDVHNVKGHGLGLSYVAGVIGQHGGHIAVESAYQEGTCFTIVLPR